MVLLRVFSGKDTVPPRLMVARLQCWGLGLDKTVLSLSILSSAGSIMLRHLPYFRFPYWLLSYNPSSEPSRCVVPSAIFGTQLISENVDF